MQAFRHTDRPVNGLFYGPSRQNAHSIRVRRDVPPAHGKHTVSVKGGICGTDRPSNAILCHSRQLGGLAFGHRRIGDHTANDSIFTDKFPAENISLPLAMRYQPGFTVCKAGIVFGPGSRKDVTVVYYIAHGVAGYNSPNH